MPLPKLLASREDPERAVEVRTAEIIALAEDLRAEIAERRRVEEQRTRLATAIEQVTESVLIHDPERRILYVNPAFERSSGYSREEAIGQTTYSLLKSFKHDEAFYHRLGQTLARGELWQGRLINRRKDGTTYEVEATISPVRDDSGKIVNYVSVQRDVSRERELESRLRQAQKMEAIGTLAGGIAHDFNNILHSIFGYTELAMGMVPAASDLHSHLQGVLDAARRAAELVNQILTFSRRSAQARKSLCLQPVLKEALKLLQRSLPSTAEIYEEIDPDCGPVLGDPTEIHQVIMNLCTNACQAMHGQRGRIEVNLDEIDLEAASEYPALEPGRFVRLTVRDTGAGMEEAIQERIFDPYFTTKVTGEGTGLGLATVHGIVNAMHGAVTVRSVPGEGTTFEVCFPRCREEIAAREGEDGEGIPPEGQERVLFVDDEESIVRIAETALRRLGYRVTACTDALEAQDRFRAQPAAFDVVITDLTMPKATGLELAAEIRQVRADLPIILATGFSDLVDPQKARALGIREVVKKPLGMRELGAVIQRVLP